MSPRQADSAERTVIVATFALGVLTGIVGHALGGDGANAGRLTYMLQDLLWVLGALVAAFRAQANRETFLAAGMAAFALARGLLGISVGEDGFAGAIVFFIPAFVLIFYSGSIPIWSRISGLLSAAVTVVYVFLYVTAHSVTSTGMLATAGILLGLIAALGWIAVYVRPAAKVSATTPAA